MPWSDLADSVIQTCMGTFGQSVVYIYAAGSSITINGIFDAAHKSVSMKDGLQFSSVHPTLGVRLADFTTPPITGDSLVIDGTTYYVVDQEPDGSGMTNLILQE
jgi:hypothetical protein